MEEMMEDAMGDTLDPEDLEEDIQLEVDKVLSEITADKNVKVKPALKTQDTLNLPEAGSATLRDEPEEEEPEVEEDLAEMQERLQALRS